MAQAITILMNEAMKLERTEVLGAAPYERAASRRGYAHGCKPKTVNSRLERLELREPQQSDNQQLSGAKGTDPPHENHSDHQDDHRAAENANLI
jgi:hypothetical protein